MFVLPQSAGFGKHQGGKGLDIEKRKVLSGLGWRQSWEFLLGVQGAGPCELVWRQLHICQPCCYTQLHRLSHGLLYSIFIFFPGLTFVFFLPCSPPGSGNEGLAGFGALLAGEALLGSCVSIDSLKQSLAGLQTQRTQNYVRNDGSSSAGPPSSCSQRRL